MTQPEINPDRVRAVITHAVNGLDPQDRAERVAHCLTHNQHGVTMHPDTADNLVEFRWGGRTLALLPVDVLTGDGPLHGEFVSEAPDDLSELDGDA
jgi:hypothetical protein